jgi:hypothetical protein
VLATPEPRWIGEGNPSDSTAFDSGVAIERSAVLAIEPVPIASSHLPHAVKAKEKFDLSPVSGRCQAVGPQEVARLSTTVNTTKSTLVDSKRMSLHGLCLSLTHCGARCATLLSRLKRPLQSLGALCRWPPAQRQGCQSAVGSIRWPRMLVFLYELLTEPVDPMQLWRLPYSWLFKARPKLSLKSK